MKKMYNLQKLKALFMRQKSDESGQKENKVE